MGGACSSTKTDYINSTITSSVVVSSDENRFLCLWVEDEAGNADIDFSDPTKPLRVDTTLPSTTISYAGGWQSTSDLNVECTDHGLYDVNVSGCQTIRYNIAGAGYLTFTNTDGNQPFPKTISMPDGNSSFLYYSTDRAGNSETVISTYVAVDTVGPINPDINVDTFVSDDKPDLDLYAYDATSGMNEMAFSCDDTNWTAWITYAITYTDFNILDSSFGCNTTQGDKNVFVKFRDNANNESASAMAATNYDTNGSTISLTPSVPSAWINTDFNATVSCADYESGVDSIGVSIGGVPEGGPYTDYNFSVSADGNHALIYLCTDNAGNNTYGPSNLYIPIDKTAPSTSISVSGWQTTDINALLTCTDPTSGCASTIYRLDTDASSAVTYGAWAAYTPGIVITVDGNYAIDFNSMDNAGNQESISTALLLLDKTVPTIDSNSLASVSTDDVTFSYSADDNVSGISGYWVRVDSGAWIWTTSTSYVFNNLANGDHNFYVMATNNADLNSAQEDTNANVNYTPPEAPASPSGGSGGGPINGLPTSNDEPVDAPTTTDEPSTTDGGSNDEPSTTPPEDTLTIVDTNVSDTNTQEEPLAPTGFFGLGELGPLTWIAIILLIVLAFVAATNKRIRGLFIGEQ